MNRAKVAQSLNALVMLYGGVLFGPDRRYRRKIPPDTGKIDRIEQREGKLYADQVAIAERHWKELVELGFPAPRSWHPHCVRVYGQSCVTEILADDGGGSHYLLVNPGPDRNKLRKILAEMQVELDRLACAPREYRRAEIHIVQMKRGSKKRPSVENRLKGVSLLDAALILTDEDHKLAREKKTSWQKLRTPKLPDAIGICPNHRQVKLFAPSAIAEFVENVEGKSLCTQSKLRQRLNAKAREPRQQ